MIQLTPTLVYFLDYYEFDSLIKELYGHEYNIVAEHELNNDTAIVWEIDESREHFSLTYHLRDAIEFARTGKSVSGYALLSVAARAGKVPNGIYVIEICW